MGGVPSFMWTSGQLRLPVQALTVSVAEPAIGLWLQPVAEVSPGTRKGGTLSGGSHPLFPRNLQKKRFGLPVPLYSTQSAWTEAAQIPCAGLGLSWTFWVVALHGKEVTLVKGLSITCKGENFYRAREATVQHPVSPSHWPQRSFL